MNDLWRLSAGELAKRIAAKEISSREVVEAHLARIEDVNPRVNAIVRVLDDEALKAASVADEQVSAGKPLGPLHGVPFTVKENIDMAGLPTTWGVSGLAHALAPFDAPVVERMRAAGAIPIGRTNLPDMALRPSTDSSLYGLTKNPWKASRTAGGSSGGEAVALATGMSPIGLGNDIGGSLRNPANACGIASIRPSAGRVPSAQYIPNAEYLLVMQLMNVQGPMGRSIADVRLALQALMGAHPRDPWSIDAPFTGVPLSGPIRVAVVSEPPGQPVDLVVSAAVRHAADALSNAGYDVVDACPPRYEEAIDVWGRFAVGDFMSEVEQLAPLLGSGGVAFLHSLTKSIPGFSNSLEMSALLKRRDGIARDWSVFMATHPLVLSPTWTKLTPEHGYDIASEQGSDTISVIRPVLPANLLGLPSVCVPATRDKQSGLPIGVLVNGQRFREDLCLSAAEVIEAGSGIVTPIEPQS